MKNHPQPKSFAFIQRHVFLCFSVFVLSVHAYAADTGAAVTAEASVSSGSGVVSSGSGSALPVAGLSVSASGENTTTDNLPPGVIARVGDKDVKFDDIRATIASLESSERDAMAANPAMLKRVVLSLLVERLLMKEVSAKQWDMQPDVKAHLDRVRQTTLAEMYLQAVSQPPADYPNNAELQSAYEANKAAYTVPHQFRIAQILIALPEDADTTATVKARKKLETVIDAFKQPDADFAKIARTQSDEAASAAQGGDMGWIDEKKMPLKIRLQAMTLARNVISLPIQIHDGWHIIKVVDTKDIGPLALEEVKAGLVQNLRAQRAEADRKEYVAKLLKATPVTINDQILTKLLNKTSN